MGKKTPKQIDVTKIATRAQAMRALKAIGFVESQLVLTRGTKMLKGCGLSVTLAPANFLITDREGDLGFIPMCMHIGNTAQNANAKHAAFLEAFRETGIIAPDVQELPILGLAVAIAELAHLTRSADA